MKNNSPGMVQLEVNSSSLLSTLRPRSLAIVLRRKTQASSMTAVTVAETRLRLLRGNHPGLLCKPLFPPSWPPWPPWPLRSEGIPPEMKTFIDKKKQSFYIRSYLKNIQIIIIGLKQKLCKPLYSPSRPPWPPWPLRSEGKPPRVKTCIDKKTRLKQLYLQFQYFLKARVSPSKHHVYVSTGSIRAYKFKFWWFLWLNKKWYKKLIKIYPNIHQGIMDPNIFNIRILSSVFKWHLLKRFFFEYPGYTKSQIWLKKDSIPLCIPRRKPFFYRPSAQSYTVWCGTYYSVATWTFMCV